MLTSAATGINNAPLSSDAVKRNFIIQLLYVHAVKKYF